MNGGGDSTFTMRLWEGFTSVASLCHFPQALLGLLHACAEGSEVAACTYTHPTPAFFLLFTILCTGSRTFPSTNSRALNSLGKILFPLSSVLTSSPNSLPCCNSTSCSGSHI